ncbi:MAG: MBL fold metallo-hydrolase [Chloroflexi bacterium]|nr:MBL fold metallo-hydrolase [Chloroflexota bacterium]
MKKYLRVMLTVIMIVLCTVGLTACNNQERTKPHVPNTPYEPPQTIVKAGEYSVHFIDVGQGDAILIDYGEFEILIDAGDNAKVNRDNLINYLKNYVDGPIEYVVATHSDLDHIGGMNDVFSQFEVGAFWHNGRMDGTATARNLMSQVGNKGVPNHIAQINDQITFNGITLTVISTNAPSYDNNNSSIVFILDDGNTRMLLTGDAERPAELNYIQYITAPIDIIKIGHHASRTSTCDELLAVCQPKTAIYMSKTGNSYGHPHIEIITKLQSLEIAIYGTDTMGDIIIAVTQAGYTISTQK